MRPISEGGVLEGKGMVDVVSCLTPDGKQIGYYIRKGVWVVFEADTEYLKNCFEEYNVVTDPSGKYMSLYKRWHLIGLELAISKLLYQFEKKLLEHLLVLMQIVLLLQKVT